MSETMPMSPSALPLFSIAAPPQTPSPAGTKPPLLLMLHGVGSNEQDLFGMAEYLDPRFFVVSVRSPLAMGPSAFGWYPVIFTAEGAVGDTKKAQEALKTLIQFIEMIPSVYDIDPERIYLMGFSQGAIMSVFTALTHPDLIAGAVIMSGRLLPEAWNARASDDALRPLHLFAVHGLNDRVLTIADGRNLRDHLSTLPLDFSYREYPMAHEVSNASIADIAAYLKARLDA